MDEKELEIIIHPDGKVTVHTHGIKGEQCMDYADFLVQLLGREDSRQKTAEFYESEENQTQSHIHQQR